MERTNTTLRIPFNLVACAHLMPSCEVRAFDVGQQPCSLPHELLTLNHDIHAMHPVVTNADATVVVCSCSSQTMPHAASRHGQAYVRMISMAFKTCSRYQIPKLDGPPASCPDLAVPSYFHPAFCSCEFRRAEKSYALHTFITRHCQPWYDTKLPNAIG